MASEDTWFKIDETKPHNAYLLKKIKEVGSLRKLAKILDVSAPTMSNALNNKDISKLTKLKIAAFFKVDTIEIWG